MVEILIFWDWFQTVKAIKGRMRILTDKSFLHQNSLGQPGGQVATLQRHWWFNVCSKFHENRGILQPISRNRDMGVFFTLNFVKPPKKGYILTPNFELSWHLSAINYFQWTFNLVLCNIQWPSPSSTGTSSSLFGSIAITRHCKSFISF